MRRWLLIGIMVILTACSGDENTATLGNNPFNPGSNDTVTPQLPGDTTNPSDPVDPRLAKLSLSASGYTVLTDNSDTTVLTVTALDQNNAALEGVTVSANASAGLLNTAKSITGEDGTAAFTFRAGPERTNQVATITVTSGGLEKSIPILITGTMVSLNTTKTSVLQHDPNGIGLSGQVLDAAGKPVFGEVITLSSVLGNHLSETDSLSTSTASPSIELISDVNGEFRAIYNGEILGKDTVNLKGCGVQKSVDLTVKDTSFGFVEPAPNTSIPTGSTRQLIFQWEDSSGPKIGEALTFTASHGSFAEEGVTPGKAEMVTDSQGQATLHYTASHLATPAIIQVSSATGMEDFLNLTILAVDPNRLDVQASPTVIPPSIGSVASTSTIVAKVRDSESNPVHGALVNFQLLSGPGGGESIFPVSATTDASGQATTTFTAGSLTSAQNGVKIRATTGEHSDDVELTIGHKAARIVIGTSNQLELIVRDGLEVAFGMPVTVLVTDNNANPIPNQRVNLGLYTLRYRTGYWVKVEEEDGTKYSQPVITAVFSNEDQNRNGILDQGEDLNLNGRLDPGNVASIPSEVTTDENGLAWFKILYAKSFAVWTDVELSATTLVSGSETRTIQEIDLPWLADEDGYPVEPVIHSPFGF